MIGMRKRLDVMRGWGRWEPALWIVSLAFVALALLVRHGAAQEAPQTLAAAQQPIQLVGTVVNPAGHPLVGAMVSVTGENLASLTDAKGRFSLPNVKPGTVSLTADQLGYDTLTVNRTAQAGVPVTLTMTPKPMLLEGLHVVVNRLKQRRESTAFTVQSWNRKQLATTAQLNMRGFIRGTMGLWTTPCPADMISTVCIFRRNYTFAPTVYIDEVPVMGGLSYLETYRPSDLYLIESYGNGAEIRAYTMGFMARAAKTRLQPMALGF